MVRMTFQSNVLFLGKRRSVGDVVEPDELQKAIAEGRTTMTAVTAMKNRGLAIIQDEANDVVDQETVARIERNLAKIAKAMNVEIEEAPAAQPKAEAKKPSRRKSAA